MLAVPKDAITGLNDLDVLPMGEPKVVSRKCTCGNCLKIEIQYDEEDNLKGIDCLEGCYIRKPHKGTWRSSRFELGAHPGTYIYCSSCGARRSWRLFN